jgi:hypothetical protein
MDATDVLWKPARGNAWSHPVVIHHDEIDLDRRSEHGSERLSGILLICVSQCLAKPGGE